jgi:hypothetical protein
LIFQMTFFDEFVQLGQSLLFQQKHLLNILKLLQLW